jgi:hypothetical protein
MVPALALIGGRAHFDGHTLNRLWMPVVPQEFHSKHPPYRCIHIGCSEESLNVTQVGEHSQVAVPLAPVHLVSPRPHHVAEGKPRVRRLALGEDFRHIRESLSQRSWPAGWPASASSGSGRRPRIFGGSACCSHPHGEVTRYTLPSSPRRPRGMAYTITHSSVETLRCHHSIGFAMFVANHRCAGRSTLLWRQLWPLLHLRQGGRGTCLNPRPNYKQSHPKPQQLSKRFLRCHRRSSSCGRQTPHVPTTNGEEQFLVKTHL